MRERNRMLDSLKGFAIILVVLGHVIQTVFAPDSYDDNAIFKIIYSFHMPLFIFISGYLSGCKERLDFNWIRRRFLRLGIPFWLWVFLDLIICGKWSVAELLESYFRVFYDPSDRGLWFLWVLFLCCILIYICQNIIENVMKLFHKSRFQTMGSWRLELTVVFLVLAVLFGIWCLTGFTTVLGFRLCCKEAIFFISGYYIRKFKQSTNINGKRLKKEIWIYVLYPISVCVWDRTHFVTFYDKLLEFAGDDITLKAGVLGFAAIYFYWVSFLGIGFIWKIFEHITTRFQLIVLPQIGMYTMEIYILHRYFFKRFIGQRWIDSILSVILGIVMPVIIGKICSRRPAMKSQS